MKKSDPERFRPIAERHGVSFLVKFGSQASGVPGPLSDTDILVGLPQTPSLLEEARLKADLAEALGVAEDTLDLSFAGSAGGLLVVRALEEGEVLYSAGPELRRAQLQAWRRMQTEKKFHSRREDFIRRVFKAA
jgi:predicted nucleotidyltransferase